MIEESEEELLSDERKCLDQKELSLIPALGDLSIWHFLEQKVLPKKLFLSFS